MKKITAAQATVVVLRKTNNEGVSAQDWGLLSLIDKELGHRYYNKKSLQKDWNFPSKYHKRIIDAIDYTNKDELIKGVCGFHRKVRTFWLPEFAPDWAKSKDE